MICEDQVARRRAANETRAKELCELAALVNAATARLVTAAAEFDRDEGWSGHGIISCAHWLSVNAGFDRGTGHEFVRVGNALAELPLLRAALAAGEVSYDKVRVATRVAVPADEHIWLEVARQATGAQLSRICRAYRRCAETDDPAHDAAHMERRMASWYWDDDGMLHLTAVLGTDDGALVVAALESIRDERGLPRDPKEPTPVPDPCASDDGARRADALVEVCDRAMAAREGDGDAAKALTKTMVVHVDVGVLTGETPDGQCHVEGGPALSRAAALRIGCDAQVLAITERDGLPIDSGRLHRIVPTALRRAIHVRDRTCRFPGCAVPVSRTDAHHVVSWIDLGRTDRDGVVSLCRFHHGRLHDGAYSITADGEGGFVFLRADGDPIALPTPAFDDPIAALRERIDTRLDGAALFAQDSGTRFKIGYVVSAIVEACWWAQTEADEIKRADETKRAYGSSTSPATAADEGDALAMPEKVRAGPAP